MLSDPFGETCNNVVELDEVQYEKELKKYEGKMGYRYGEVEISDEREVIVEPGGDPAKYYSLLVFAEAGIIPCYSDIMCVPLKEKVLAEAKIYR